MASQMVQTGHIHFGPYFHGYRRMLLPGSANKINDQLSYDDLFKYIVIANGAIMGAAGLLILLGNRKLGPLLLISQMLFLIVL